MKKQPKTEQKMTLEEFAKALLETNDLDPLYTMILFARLPKNVLANYLLAYWCFYDTGTCCWICSQPDYWEAMQYAGSNNEHPRGGDRRHFRGDNSKNAINHLISLKETPLDLLKRLGCNNKLTNLGHVMGKIQELVGFGPTIAFKAADMLERFEFARYAFGAHKTTDPTLMSKDPTTGAEKITGFVGNVAQRVADKTIKHILEGYPAPPRMERPISVLETETVCCKWNHYLKGSYKIGTGTEHQLKGLLKYKTLPLAQQLLRAGVKSGLWKKEQTV